MSYPELLLSNQLCFLVHRLDLAMAAKYRPVLAPLGLTYGQYLAMLALWEHRELGVGELCELLRLDSGTVSPLLKRLEASGLVERKRRAEDERSVSVRLTGAGAALEKRARKVPAALAGCLAADEAEYRAVRASLEGMLSRLEEGETQDASLAAAR
jgi:DNA-binding MarR family transcriptional regulator